MPIYEFRCKKCKHHFEDYVPSPFAPLNYIKCPKCGSKNFEKLISAPVIRSANSSSTECTDSGSSDFCNTCPMN